MTSICAAQEKGGWLEPHHSVTLQAKGLLAGVIRMDPGKHGKT